jgi:hypothetical protein
MLQPGNKRIKSDRSSRPSHIGQDPFESIMVRDGKTILSRRHLTKL